MSHGSLATVPGEKHKQEGVINPGEVKIIGIGTGIVFGNTAWIAHIIVNPEFRRRGIGRKIVIKLLNIIFSKGMNR